MKHYFLILLASFALVFAGCDKNPSPTYYGGSGGSGTDGGGSDSGSTNATVDVSMLTQLRINMMDDTIEKCWHWVITNGSQTKEGYIWTTEKAIATELFQAYNHYLDEGVTVKCTYTPTSATDVDGCKAPDSGGGSGGDNPGGGDDPVNPGGGDGDGDGDGEGGGDDDTPGTASDGLLSGKFSIGYGKKIQFSQGNLQYRASTNTWRFAEHQWSFVGSKSEGNVYEDGVKSNNKSIADDYTGWIDLFGWGTSGWNSGAKEYQPWSRSASSGDYYIGNSSWNDLTGSYAEADWGVHNAISNGGKKAGMWRTLTDDEWCYLLHGRSMAEGLVSSGKVNDVCGIILLPDNWSGAPAGISFVTFVDKDEVEWTADSYYDIPDNAYTYNSLTESEWKKMESAGAVFLPAAGYRVYTDVTQPNWYGAYWSTTAHKTAEDLALVLGFQSEGVYLSGASYRSYGYSVRLVRDN